MMALQPRAKNLIMLNDNKDNAKAVLGSLAAILQEPISQVLAHTGNTMAQQELLFKMDQTAKESESIDFSKVIEAQGVANKIIRSNKVVPAEHLAELNAALDFVSAFENSLKAGRAFDLAVLLAMPSDKLEFFKWLAASDNNVRTLKELSARNKEICEALIQRLSPALQAMLQDHLGDGPATVTQLVKFMKDGLELSRGTYDVRLLAMMHAEFDATCPYQAYLSLLSMWTDAQRARIADGLQKLPNEVLYSAFTAKHFKATSDMAARAKLLKMKLDDGLPDHTVLEAILDSASRLQRIQGDAVTPGAAAMASSYAQKASPHVPKGLKSGIKRFPPPPKAPERKPNVPLGPHMEFQPGHCQNFAKTGSCTYGRRCRFKHVAYSEGKAIRVVVFGNKDALAAAPGKATSAAAAAEEDYDDGYHESFGAPEASFS